MHRAGLGLGNTVWTMPAVRESSPRSAGRLDVSRLIVPVRTKVAIVSEAAVLRSRCCWRRPARLAALCCQQAGWRPCGVPRQPRDTWKPETLCIPLSSSPCVRERFPATPRCPARVPATAWKTSARAWQCRPAYSVPWWPGWVLLTCPGLPAARAWLCPAASTDGRHFPAPGFRQRSCSHVGEGKCPFFADSGI